MTDTTSPALTPAEKLKGLYALHVALGEIAGFSSRLVTHKPEKPVLQVRNDHAGKLIEHITVAEQDGQRWFVWSWGEPMLSVDEVAEAARRVVHVLTPPREENITTRRSRT